MLRARFLAKFALSRARSFAALRMTAKGSESQLGSVFPQLGQRMEITQTRERCKGRYHRVLSNSVDKAKRLAIHRAEE
jgi:hypothetical protein